MLLQRRTYKKKLLEGDKNNDIIDNNTKNSREFFKYFTSKELSSFTLINLGGIQFIEKSQFFFE